MLIACILSIRTYDEDSLPAALHLFEKAPDPAFDALVADLRMVTDTV